MLLIIECVLACGLFTLLVLPPLYRNPLGQIMSYPKEIRRRVEQLPQYQGRIRTVEKKHLSIKVMAVFLFALILAAVAYGSGAKTLSAALGVLTQENVAPGRGVSKPLASYQGSRNRSFSRRSCRLVLRRHDSGRCLFQTFLGCCLTGANICALVPLQKNLIARRSSA